MKDKKFLALSSFFFLLFIVGMLVLTFDKPTSSILRAKNATPSPLKSFAIVFPQVGTAGEEGSAKPPTKIKVSVYIRDINGNALSSRSVKLSSNPSTSITPADTQTTNDFGMTQFFITSKTSAKVQLTATDVASNTSVSNIPTIDFTD